MRRLLFSSARGTTAVKSDSFQTTIEQSSKYLKDVSDPKIMPSLLVYIILQFAASNFGYIALTKSQENATNLFLRSFQTYNI